MIETTEGVDDTYKRVLQEKGFKPTVFIADNESATVKNVTNILKTIPATKDWKVSTSEGFGNDTVEITDKEGNIIASFDLDATDGFNAAKATDYIDNLINLAISNTDDKGKALMIEGKQTKTTKPAAVFNKNTSTSKPTTTTTTAAP
jgi:hypothetical protein